jgi:hypothetical protein
MHCGLGWGWAKKINLCMVIPGLDAHIFVQHCKSTAKRRYGVLLKLKKLTAAVETTPIYAASIGM